jgi:hypothetical protein
MIKNSSNFKKPEFWGLDNNKLFFALFCNSQGLPTPHLGGYNFTNNFYLDGDARLVRNAQDVKKYFEDLFLKTEWNSVFLKPMEGERGQGCFKIYADKLDLINEDLTSILLSNSYIYQDVIKQNDVLNKFNPNSVNTIRLDTYTDRSGVLHILDAFLRIGTGEDVVDNSSAGGCFVEINIESGKLNPAGYFMMEYGGGEIDAHPVSGIKFDGLEIPYFQDVKSFIQKSHILFPHRILGWDIAITEKGLTLIEINSNPDLGYKHPMFAEILNEA